MSGVSRKFNRRIDLRNLKKKKKVFTSKIYRLDHQDWMREFQKDVAKGNPIMIRTAKAVQEDTFARVVGSSYDPAFLVPLVVDSNIITHSCSCGRHIGRFNEGDLCPSCNTPVEVQYSTELLRRGWIDIGKYYVMPPTIYLKVQAYIGEDRLNEILDYKYSIDRYGNVVDNSNKNSRVPFSGIGMVEFHKRYAEILETYKALSRKPELYPILKERIDITFTNKINVMSAAIRPMYGNIANGTLSYNSINAAIGKIASYCRQVYGNGRREMHKIPLLRDIQQILCEIYTLSIKKLDGKKRLLRGSTISGRLWYSSRMVMVAETKLTHSNLIRMSYKGFISLFELEILNAMMRGDCGSSKFREWTDKQCQMYVRECKHKPEIDQDLWNISQVLINERTDDGIYVLINRNPALDLGSIQCFKLDSLIPNAYEFIVTLPHNSLKEMNADFDGDVGNVFSPKERIVIEAWKRGFSPSKLMLDRTGLGGFNKNMSPIKDEYAFLRSFADPKYNPIVGDEAVIKSMEDIKASFKEPIFDYKKKMKDKELEEFNEFYSKLENYLPGMVPENEISLLQAKRFVRQHREEYLQPKYGHEVKLGENGFESEVCDATITDLFHDSFYVDDVDLEGDE